MNKLISCMIPMALLVGSVSAGGGLKGDGKFGTAGCGLGSLVFADQKGFIQILAGTINNTIIPQSSAITTGTSNCFEDGVALKEKEQEFFANANFESLHQEIAQGQGENLKAFASLFGCQGQGVELFSTAAHTSYGAIFPSAKTNSTDMLANLQAMVKNRPDLQTSCSERG